MTISSAVASMPVTYGTDRRSRAEARQPRPDPERTSYSSFFSFNDPDGNLWLVRRSRRGPLAGSTRLRRSTDPRRIWRVRPGAPRPPTPSTRSASGGQQLCQRGRKRGLARLVRLVHDGGAGRDGPTDVSDFGLGPVAAVRRPGGS